MGSYSDWLCQPNLRSDCKFCKTEGVQAKLEKPTLSIWFSRIIIAYYLCHCKQSSPSRAVITLANHKKHRQYSEPIKTQSNYMKLTQRARKRVRAGHDWCCLTSDWMKSGARFLSQSRSVVSV